MVLVLETVAPLISRMLDLEILMLSVTQMIKGRIKRVYR